MEWLCDIAQEMCHPLECIGARQVLAVGQGAALDVANAAPQYACLVGNGANNAATLCTVVRIVQATILRWVIMRVYPVPLIGEAALVCVCVRVCPGGCAANRPVVLGFEDLSEDSRSRGREKSLGHEAYLVMNYGLSVAEVCCEDHAHHRCSTLRL
jgi:hypothetical protein